MNRDVKDVMLKCDDNSEIVVFSKDTYPDGTSDYEFNIMDKYCGGDYKGFIGRFKRAWKAFHSKPVYYTGIYCEDTERIKKFLQDCLDLIED